MRSRRGPGARRKIRRNERGRARRPHLTILGKYSPTFQRRLEGASLKVDHSTAGAQLAVQLAAKPDDRLIAQVLAHAVAGHHAGLPNTIGDEGSLDRSSEKRH